MSMREEGFTILETLVALAILSVVLVALYAGASNSLRAVDRGTRAHHIALLARSKLDEIAAGHGTVPRSSLGVFAGTDIVWRIAAGEIPNSYAGRTAVVLQDITLTLDWPDGFSRRSATFWTRHLGSVRR
jgi:prepilin-type N-terminal cleavage/methylation domain-containing protein